MDAFSRRGRRNDPLNMLLQEFFLFQADPIRFVADSCCKSPHHCQSDRIETARARFSKRSAKGRQSKRQSYAFLIIPRPAVGISRRRAQSVQWKTLVRKGEGRRQGWYAPSMNIRWADSLKKIGGYTQMEDDDSREEETDEKAARGPC